MSTLGLKIPTVGPQTLDPGLAVMASEAEAAGASSVWVSDHIVMTEQTESHYPYATGGKVTWQVPGSMLSTRACPLASSVPSATVVPSGSVTL